MHGTHTIGRFYFVLRVQFSVFEFVVRFGRRGPLRFMLVRKRVAGSCYGNEGRRPVDGYPVDGFPVDGFPGLFRPAGDVAVAGAAAGGRRFGPE